MTKRATIAAIVALCTAASAARADDRPPGATRPAAQSDLWTQRNVGTAIIVGGIAVDVGALVLGLDAMKKRDSAREAGCHDDLTECPSNALPTAQAAYHSANRATILFALGTVGVGIGLYLRVTAPRAHAVTVSPAIGPDTAGAALSGSF